MWLLTSYIASVLTEQCSFLHGKWDFAYCTTDRRVTLHISLAALLMNSFVNCSFVNNTVMDKEKDSVDIILTWYLLVGMRYWHLVAEVRHMEDNYCSKMAQKEIV